MASRSRSPSPNLTDEDRAYLGARDNPRQIANRIAQGRQRLGYYTVLCFLVNRIVGTGIFVSPGAVISGTQSVGFSLLFWLFGAISFFAVSYLYVEFGLNVPRYKKIPVPRNGGELNYVRYHPIVSSISFLFFFLTTSSLITLSSAHHSSLPACLALRSYCLELRLETRFPSQITSLSSCQMGQGEMLL
jgi:hypothetical protein